MKNLCAGYPTSGENPSRTMYISQQNFYLFLYKIKSIVFPVIEHKNICIVVVKNGLALLLYESQQLL